LRRHLRPRPPAHWIELAAKGDAVNIAPLVSKHIMASKPLFRAALAT